LPPAIGNRGKILRFRFFGFFGRFRRRKPREEPVYFSKLKRLNDDEWRAALAESPAKAAHWVYAAASYGNAEAQLYWAQMLLDGYGTQRDVQGAFRWFKIAAASKNVEAINMLGRCYERGWGTPVDCEKAAACYREAAEQSHDWARYNLASLLLDGNGVERDVGLAFDLLTQAAAQDHVKSMTVIGHFHEHGWECPRDIPKAMQWYRRGAEGGDFRGQYRYGKLLFEQGQSDDALPWLHRAVDNAPLEFCYRFASELLSHPEPALQKIGAHAEQRIMAIKANTHVRETDMPVALANHHPAS
jgi:TPR repeat protein